MNVQPRHAMRALAITVLLAVGIATTISSGGGGGSSGQPTPSADLVTISGDNAQDVASTLMIAINTSFNISEITGGEIVLQSSVGSPRVQKLLKNDQLAAGVMAAEAPAGGGCPGGGTVTVTYTLADPNTLTVGDQITADFDNCDEGGGYVLDGLMDMTVAAFDGDINTDVFLLGLDIAMIDMAITEGTETALINANVTLTLDTLAFPVIVETLEGEEFSLATGPELLTFTNFEHVFQVDIGVAPEAVLVTVNGRMDSVQLGGAVDYATTIAIEALGDDDPHTGEILITGDDSSVRIVINDSTSVTLEVDSNGDGVIDEYIETTFAALLGNVSSIDTENALAVAQEVTRANAGFGLITALPGRQFLYTEIFGQVQQMGLSGEFGPLELACENVGTAVVSGSVATAGTFTANDSLSVIFAGCNGNYSDVSNGQLDVVVSSFTQDAVENPDITPPFNFIGTATATSLESIAPNGVWYGTGTVETNYNYTQYFGPLYIDGYSASFSVAHVHAFGEYATYRLNDASASFSTTVEAGTFGGYEGWLTSDRLSGIFRFESVLPYDWVPWAGDPRPTTGELLITADDGSTVRIVVIDDQNVRLDVDYDGDLIADDTIATTWDQLL